MNIDPRTMKLMLKLQLDPGFDFQSVRGRTNNSVSHESASMFDMLLSQQLNGSALEGSSADFAPLVWSPELWAHVAPAAAAEGAYAAGYAASEASEPYKAVIAQAAMKYGVDQDLIHAVIETESGFDPAAQSHAGAKGLMQLMDGTARGLGVTDSFDPIQNIDGGTRYLSLLLRKYNGNEQVALAAYNAGPGRIDSLGIATDEQLQAGMGLLPEETRRYIHKVMQAR